MSWWPLRQLQALGVHPLWSTALIYALVTALLALWRPAALRDVLRTRSLWVLVLASGCTNAAFNWGVTVGDVVRVVLLFYLMPMWSVLLARWLLHEPLHADVLLRVGAGAWAARWSCCGRPTAAGRCRARRPIGWASSAALPSRSTT